MKLLLFVSLVLVGLMFFFCIGLTVEQNQTEPVDQKQYILVDEIRPTHWSQDQWEILDSYLKRIDELEKRVEELELGIHDAGTSPI